MTDALEFARSRLVGAAWDNDETPQLLLGEDERLGTPRRAYWSERTGTRSAAVPLSTAEMQSFFVSLMNELSENGYLDEAFGFECVDSGFQPGTLGLRVEERLRLVLGRSGLWPLDQDTVAEWDDDQLFDMIEFLYDHVSAGDEETGWHHKYADCGWHYESFTREPARSEFRTRINELLSMYQDGFELDESGQILRKAPDGLAPLLDAPLPGLSTENVDHLSAAIVKFRSRSSTPTQRRDAVRDLADVLENMRRDVQEHMFHADEAALFEVANKFWIRHNKAGEHRHYNHEAWWSWLFYLYLDSIALVTHLKEAQQASEAASSTNSR